MYKPQCLQPLLLVNKYCLTLLQNDGKLFLDGEFCPVQRSMVNYLPIQHYLDTARKSNSDYLENSYVISRDGHRESLFQFVPCGHCELCRHSKQVDLINRAALESATWSVPPVVFCLTYNNKNLPPDGELRYKDFQDFMKRLRIMWTRRGLKHDVRYLVAGEYGHKRGRPHYHVIMWNNPYQADELSYQFQYLKKDIFDSWGKCDWIAFDDPRNFGQCRDSAAGYVTKYVQKPCKMHGHHVKPFIHCSAGSRGGLGAILIDKYKRGLQLSPVQNYFEYVDSKGNYKWLYLSKSLSKRIWPSPSACVPSRQKELYRQLIDVVTKLYRLGLDYTEVLEPLRPSVHVRNSFVKPQRLFSCPTYQKFFGVRYVTVLCQLVDLLSESLPDVSSEYLDNLYSHRAFIVESTVYDFAQKVTKIRQKTSLLLDKTTF